MSEVSQQSLVKFDRLLFRKSTNKRKEPIYIAKLNKYTDFSGKRKLSSIMLVICNTLGKVTGGIDREGKWDVWCELMPGGKGYVVHSAVFMPDKISFLRTESQVKFLVNGREERLKREKGKIISLTFDAMHYIKPEEYIEYVVEKISFLHPTEDFNLQLFQSNLLSECKEMYKEYLKGVKNSRG